MRYVSIKIFFFFVAMQLVLSACICMAADAPNANDNAQKWYAMAIKGDAQARENLRQLAIRGDALAQNGLGAIYAFGWGVTEDDVEGLKWYIKSAEQGYGPAQYKTASMYAFGEGTAKDYAKAYMWASLAMEQHNMNGIELYEKLEGVITQEQTAQGKKLLREWKQRHHVKENAK